VVVAAGLAGADSVVDGDSVLGVDGVPSVEVPPSLDFESPDELDDADAVDARRSFLAQPDPLKWTAGALTALRSGPPPQSGQAVGGSAWTPWTISDRRPQEAQS
jgi:hypothetical protein